MGASRIRLAEESHRADDAGTVRRKRRCALMRLLPKEEASRPPGPFRRMLFVEILSPTGNESTLGEA